MEKNILLEKIKNSAEQVPVPNGLKPEEILDRLDGMEQEETIQEPFQNKQKKAKKRFPVFKICGAAAALLAITIGLRQISAIGNNVSPENRMDKKAIGADHADNSQEMMTDTDNTEPDVNGISKPASYDELYKILKRKFYRNSFEIWLENIMGINKDFNGIGADIAEDDFEMQSDKEQTNTAKADGYSTTNIQEKGVDEADIVKTDGKYLYIADSFGKIQIVETNGENMKKVSEIEPAGLDEQIEEIYIDQDILNIVACGSQTTLKEQKKQDYYAMKRHERVKLYTYDIKDRTNPALKGVITQDGSYRDSRKAGDYVYLFTSYAAEIQGREKDSDYIPSIQDRKIAAEDIYIPETITNTTYLVAASVDINRPDKIKSQKAILSAAEYFYAGTENIYIANTLGTYSGEVTQIMKYHYENGNITAAAAGEVHGIPNDSFSFSEDNGYLRMVTTEWKQEQVTHLYVLDEKLNLCGKIENLAPGERLRSSRFMGNIGYFVTFRNTDPLFSVDLSDPRNPKILGELKITGFSSYLHFWEKDKLLGIGYEVDPDTNRTIGIKLSMFDITDPANVKEVSKYVLQGELYCAAPNDYKSILVEPEKGLIGFTTDDTYIVFSYDAAGCFKTEFICPLNDQFEEFDGEMGTLRMRGLYIGNVFYLTDTKEVKMYDMSNSSDGFSMIGELKLS